MSNQPSDNRSIKLPGQEPDGMQERLLIAFALIGVVLLGMQYLLPQQQPAPVARNEGKKAAAAAASSPGSASQDVPTANKPAAAAAAAAGKPGSAAPGVIAAEKDETAVIETDLYRITFSNRGAVAQSWILKKYKDSDGKPLELVNPAATGKTVFPLAIRFHEGQSAEALNSAPYRMTVSRDGLSVDFAYARGEWAAHKTITFHKDSYLSHVASDVSNSGVPKPHLLYWRGGFGDASVIGASAAQFAVRYDLAAGFHALGVGDLGSPQAHRGKFTFAGINDAFFAAVALPPDTNRDFEIHSMSDQLENVRDKKMEPNVGMAVGGSASNQFQFFVGPKDTRLLASISPRLEQLVDYGYFGLLAKPLFLALRWLNDNAVHNYGWAIIVATIIINFLLLPLKISSLKSMKQMSVLQPQIAAINEKYKSISMTDPRAQQKNQEMMDLYKKHGVNPMGGCAPMALQIPFFIAFYKVLSSAIELRGADWLWVADLSRPETLALRILPIAMIASQFVMQKMTPATTADPAQQRMMLLMPAFLGFMFYGVSAGLVLYWLTGNLVGIAQQWFFNRFMPSPAAAGPGAGPSPAAASPKKKK